MGVDRRSFLRVGATAAVAGAVGVGTGAGASGALAKPRPKPRRGPDWEALRRSISGDVVLPADANYGQAIQLQSRQYDTIRPQGVVYCESASDVRDSLLFAQQNDLKTSARSGGHSNAGYSTSEGMVLDVSRLNQVSVSSGKAVVGAGTQAIDALTALNPHGLTTPNGTCATVAAGGFLTGGGIGLLHRSHGIGCDSLYAAEVVLASGQIVKCSPWTSPDLFWALRGGGGGNFGVITRYCIKPISLTKMVNYKLVFTWDKAPKVAAEWQQWTLQQPDGLAADLVVIMVDSSAGKVPTVVVSGTYIGTKADLDSRLDALVGMVGAAPVARVVQELSYRDTMMNWWNCTDKTPAQCHRVGYNPEGQLPRDVWVAIRGRYFDKQLSSAGIDQWLAAYDANRRSGQARVMLMRAMGGKSGTKSRTATAYVHRDAKFFMDNAAALTIPSPSAEDVAAVNAWLAANMNAIHPHSNGESYQNFMDPTLADYKKAYYAENYSRLAKVKNKYDPNGFFRFAQSI